MIDETTSKNESDEARAGQRIAKVMARAGLCSRRDAERWIAEGRVAVNGTVLDSPAFNVGEGDNVVVDGKPLAPPERTRLFLLHKARGLVTTERDPEGRPTIFENLGEETPRLVAVGRLDINTEGLILLTNDGGLARVLELPATGWLRRYRVRAHGSIEQTALDALRGGLTIDGVDYAGIEAVLDRQQGSNVWLAMGLREGKNREIKKVLEHLGLSVNRLIRVSFGPFQLGELEEGALVEVPTRVLRDQIGARLAREAGADFEGAPAGRAAPAPSHERRAARERLERGGPPTRDDRREGFKRGAPVREEPRADLAPRKRKHISQLRIEGRPDEAAPRRRVERGETRDRKGREVKIERIQPTHEEARRRAAVAERVKAREGAEARRGPRVGREGVRGQDERPRRGGPGRGRAAGEGATPFRRGGKDGFARPGRDGAPARERAPREGAAQFRGEARRGGKDGFARPGRDAAPARERAPREGAASFRGEARRGGKEGFAKPGRDGPPARGRAPGGKGRFEEGREAPRTRAPFRERAPGAGEGERGERTFRRGPEGAPRRGEGAKPDARPARGRSGPGAAGGGGGKFSGGPRKPFQKGPRKPDGGGPRPPRRR